MSCMADPLPTANPLEVAQPSPSPREHREGCPAASIARGQAVLRAGSLPVDVGSCTTETRREGPVMGSAILEGAGWVLF